MRHVCFHDLAAGDRENSQGQRPRFEKQYFARAAEIAVTEEATRKSNSQKPAKCSRKSESKRTLIDAESTPELPIPNQKRESRPRHQKRPKSPKPPKPPRPASDDPIAILHVKYSVKDRKHIEECLSAIRSIRPSDRIGNNLKNLVRKRLRSIGRPERDLGFALLRDLHGSDPVLAASIESAIRKMLEMHEDLDFISVSTWMTGLIHRLVPTLPKYKGFVEDELNHGVQKCGPILEPSMSALLVSRSSTSAEAGVQAKKYAFK